ncbi:MAG TPA: sialidase family protein [Terriglobales bacterium]|nr:sialidase family protein [Terriglobales bacterium]
MKIVYRAIVMAAFFVSVAVVASAQTTSLRDSGPDNLSCSPAPCVLPPTQASEGGHEVIEAPIVADPLNPLNLLLGSLDPNCPPPGGAGFHLSSDGGATWSRYCMPLINDFHGRTYVPGGQPNVAYDRNGTAYIASGYGDSEGMGYTLVAVQKRLNGGNWTQPVIALGAGSLDPFYSWMAVDTGPQSPHVNSLYMSAIVLNEPQQNKNQVVVAHSYDGGQTWTGVKAVPVQTAPAGDLYTSTSVGKDGTVYVTWMYCNPCSSNKGDMLFSKSNDGGNTWSTPVLMGTILQSEIPNSNVPVTNYPVIGVDNSNGPYAGSLYVVMYNWTGTFMQVQVLRSTDGGNTWSKPVPVAPGITHDQFLPWLSVSPAGLVGVSWLDRRNDPKNVEYQAFAAISTDGGKSFQPNVQLTTAFSFPVLGMGYYTGDAWDGPNYFVAAWMDDSNGVDMQEEVGGIRLK